MHLPDGLLPPAVCAAGAVTAALACAASLAVISRRPDPGRAIPEASIFTAAFFVASWVHVPVPPTSVHLVLNGLLGVALGAFAFPAVLIGLLFQAVMFQHGGLTTLGVNATVIGVPALVVGALFRAVRSSWRRSRAIAAAAGFLAGAGGVALAAAGSSALLVYAVPAGLDPSLRRTGLLALTAGHLPLALVEGVFTALVVLFLRRVQPELLER